MGVAANAPSPFPGDSLMCTLPPAHSLVSTFTSDVNVTREASARADEYAVRVAVLRSQLHAQLGAAVNPRILKV